MDRRSVSGVLVGLLVGAVLGYWWRGEEAVPSPVILSRAPPAQKRAAPTSASPPPAPIPHEEEPIPSSIDAGPYERALRVVADYAGEGVVRCDIGDLLPDGAAVGIRRARIEEGILIGAVEDPSGQARIGLPGDPPNAPPRLIVRWSGVWLGEAGHCQVLQPERILVSGRVVDTSGRPVQGEVGNAVEGTVRTDAAGNFATQCWLGADCPLAARQALGQPWGPFQTLVLDGPTDGVLLELAEAPQRDLKTFLEEQVAEDERLAHSPDPLALALTDPTLPEEAKALVNAWLDEQNEARAITKTLLADMSR